MPPPPQLTPTLVDSPGLSAIPGSQVRRLAVLGALLLATYAWPLVELARFSFGSELYSHLFLVPLTSAFFVWWNRHRLPPASRPDLRWAVPAILAGLALLGVRFLLATDPVDQLAATTLSFVAFFVAACAASLGPATLRALAFPLGFLLFFAPFPSAVTAGIEAFLQHRSADAAHVLFLFGGFPVFRHETYFELPGIRLLVAPECSGIHSTLALFIVSLVAGQVFLRSNYRRAVLAVCVLPLAIVRNAFRIFVIGQLCVRIGPEMIESYIHQHGGPIFFVLSLGPFLALLWLLARGDRAPKVARSD